MDNAESINWPRFLVPPGLPNKGAVSCENQSSGHVNSQSSDEALFARVCATGEHAAFGLIVDRYRVRVAGLARRMFAATLRGEVEDIAQETFVEAFRKRGSFKSGEPFRPWLYRIAVNRCIDRIRALERRPTSTLSDYEPVTSDREESGDPLGQVVAREQMQLIESAIQLLPPKHRAVLILRYLDDLSYEEIAAVTNLPVGTVKTHLFRARTELRRKFQDDGND